MSIPPLYGHEGIRDRLVGALASGRLPQALLFEGPRGVGKQRLALWLAQALVCENPGKGRETGNGEPCGECQPCKLVLNLSHPDVHWFVPVELPKKGADADKQVDLAAEALAEQLATRREQPLYEPPSGLASHGIASVRLMLRRLALKPALGRRKVFLLTSSEPDALLPTILSRVVRVRVARNADSIVAAFAQRELSIKSQRTIAERVTAADGSIGKLLAAGEGAGGTGQAAAAFQAAVAHGAVQRYGFALRQAPFQARGGFTAMLDGLLEQLREQARAGGETTRVVEAIARTLDARELAQGNVNPQLVAAVLADQLAEPK